MKKFTPLLALVFVFNLAASAPAAVIECSGAIMSSTKLPPSFLHLVIETSPNSQNHKVTLFRTETRKSTPQWLGQGTVSGHLDPYVKTPVRLDVIDNGIVEGYLKRGDNTLLNTLVLKGKYNGNTNFGAFFRNCPEIK